MVSAIIIASLVFIAMYSSVIASSDTLCVGRASGSITYGYVEAYISSDGYYGFGYAEVGLLERNYFYGFVMEIRTWPGGKIIGYAYSYSTNYPEHHISAYKPYEKHTGVSSWAETHLGTIDGPLDVSVGVLATTGGWCGY